MEGDPLPVKTYNHIAFKISEGDFDMYLDKITKLGLEIIDDRSRLPGEGKSIYFFDYDNHLFEQLFQNKKEQLLTQSGIIHSDRCRVNLVFFYYQIFSVAQSDLSRQDSPKEYSPV